MCASLQTEIPERDPASQLPAQQKKCLKPNWVCKYDAIEVKINCVRCPSAGSIIWRRSCTFENSKSFNVIDFHAKSNEALRRTLSKD